MAFDKIFVLVAVILTVAGLQGRSVVAQDDFNNIDQQWAPGGISPLESLAYWETKAPPAEELEKADATGCCMPKTWTSTLFAEIRREGRKQKGRTLRFAETVYVDENNKRVAQDVRIPRGPGRNATTLSYIILFKKSANASSATLYAFSKTARKCYTKVLKGAQFRPMCLPANSTLFGSFSLGTGAGALRSQSWGFVVRDRRAAIIGNVVLTPGNCVPILVAEKVYTRPRMTDDDEVDPEDKRLQVTTIGALYTDFTTVIRDPTVFTPPSYCKSDEDTLLFSNDVDFTTIVQRFVTIL